MRQGSQTHLHSLAGKKGCKIFPERRIYFKMCSEMRETMCASEKLVLYTDLSYPDFILETLSSGPSFHKSMALRYAFPFAPRSDRVNAADGAQCPALAGCWSALGSNKTFHTGQEPAPFPRLQLCVAASPVSSMRKPTGQLSKCRAGSWMIQHLTWVMAHLLDQVDQLGHFLLLLWALEGASPLGQAHLAPTSELTRVCNPCAPLKATHRRVHNVKRLSQGLLSWRQVWVLGLLVSLCCCSSPMTAFGSACICLFCCQRETDYFPGALLCFDDAKHRV